MQWIEFDFSAFVEEFGEGQITLVVQRKKDDDPYPVVLDVDGAKATWNITNVDTAYKGTGKIQLSYVVGEQIKKSLIYKIKVDASVVPASEEPPEPIQNYLDQMIEIGEQVHEDAQSVDAKIEEIDQAVIDAEAEIEQKKEEVLEDISELITFSDTGNGNISIEIGG